MGSLKSILSLIFARHVVRKNNLWKKNAVEMRDINMSIDRKDNDRGYTKDNIQLVCYRINMLRGGMDLDRFKEIISWIRGEDIFSPHYLANNKGVESFECIGVERL